MRNTIRNHFRGVFDAALATAAVMLMSTAVANAAPSADAQQKLVLNMEAMFACADMTTFEARLLENIESDPEMKDNPFAGLGIAVMMGKLGAIEVQMGDEAKRELIRADFRAVLEAHGVDYDAVCDTQLPLGEITDSALINLKADAELGAIVDKYGISLKGLAE